MNALLYPPVITCYDVAVSVTSPPLSVWFLTLAILAVLGAVVMIAFLVLEDPLAYLAGRIEPLMSWPAAASA